jgi:hypothetical protein
VAEFLVARVVPEGMTETSAFTFRGPPRYRGLAPSAARGQESP